MVDAEALSNLNAWTKPFVDNPTYDGFPGGVPLPSLDSCMMDLVRGLAVAKEGGWSDAETQKFITDALVTPFNEAAAALKQIFVPTDATTDGSMWEQVKSYSKAAAASAANPFVAIMQMQGATFNTSLKQLGFIMTGDGTANGGVAGAAKERLQTIYRTLLFGSTQAESNLAGLVMYALEEGIPALDAEVVYLRRMRKLVKTLNEQCSSLPPSFTPAIPNFAVTNRLCEAEERLRRVSAALKNERKFDRAEFGMAATAVCESKDMIFDGSVSSSTLGQIKNFFALNDKQWAALAAGKFLPNAKLRATMIELQMLDACMLRADTQVVSLHRNLQGLMLNLQSLSSIHAADIFALIVQVLKRQIGALRADLEAQSAGFKGALATVPGAPISQEATDGAFRQTKYGPNRRFTNAGSNATNNDVFSYLGSQVTAYAMLTSMCFLMDRAQLLYKNIDAIVNGNSRFIKMVMDIVGMYKGITCGTDLGATLVDESLHAYFDTIEGRLNGTVTNNARIGEAAKRTIKNIDDHLQFLACMRTGLFMGRSRLADQASMVLNAVSAARNLAGLISKVRDVRQIAKTLDLQKLTAAGAIEYNQYDVLMRALQCLVLQCNNEALRKLLAEAQTQFGKQFDAKKAQAITMGALGELPRISQQVALNQRVQAAFRLLASLQRITAMNPRDLCAIQTKPKPKAKAAPKARAADIDADRKKKLQDGLGTGNKASQASEEEAARQAAIAARTPLA